jgi:hypothetical protein
MCRVGRQVEVSLAEVELRPASAPASILFPASHGYGLAFTLLLQVFTKPEMKVTEIKVFTKPEMEVTEIKVFTKSEMEVTEIKVFNKPEMEVTEIDFVRCRVTATGFC